MPCELKPSELKPHTIERWGSFGVHFDNFGVDFEANFEHFEAILGTKMVPKSAWGHLWGPIAPQGGPLSVQGCDLAGRGGHFGLGLGSFSAPK